MRTYMTASQEGDWLVLHTLIKPQTDKPCLGAPIYLRQDDVLKIPGQFDGFVVHHTGQSWALYRASQARLVQHEEAKLSYPPIRYAPNQRQAPGLARIRVALTEVAMYDWPLELDIRNRAVRPHAIIRPGHRGTLAADIAGLRGGIWQRHYTLCKCQACLTIAELRREVAPIPDSSARELVMA